MICYWQALSFKRMYEWYECRVLIKIRYLYLSLRRFSGGNYHRMYYSYVPVLLGTLLHARLAKAPISSFNNVLLTIYDYYYSSLLKVVTIDQVDTFGWLMMIQCGSMGETSSLFTHWCRLRLGCVDMPGHPYNHIGKVMSTKWRRLGLPSSSLCKFTPQGRHHWSSWYIWLVNDDPMWQYGWNQ